MVSVILHTWCVRTCIHREAYPTLEAALRVLAGISTCWAARVTEGKTVLASRRRGSRKIVGVLPCGWDGRTATLAEALYTGRPLQCGQRG